MFQARPPIISFLISMFLVVLTWLVVIAAVVVLTGCMPISLEASGSFNMGEHQEIHRKYENRVKTGTVPGFPEISEVEEESPQSSSKPVPISPVLPPPSR